MPVFNRESLISTAIQSVLNQTYSHWELIVIDDRSTDNTKQVVANYVKQDSRIQYFVNDRTQGPGGARNCGILKAQGEFIAFLDSDDEWFNYHLKDSVRTINEAQVDISFALWWIKQQNNEPFYYYEHPLIVKYLEDLRNKFGAYGETIIFDKGLFEQYLNDQICLYHINTMVVKKELIHIYGLFNEVHNVGEDSEFMINFFDKCKVALITKPHFIYYESPDSLYFFCNRYELDPDSLYQDEKLLKKIEDTGLKSIKFKTLLKGKVEESDHVRDKKNCILNINSGIGTKYYTLSYLNRRDKKVALQYCRLSHRIKPTMFNRLLLCHLYVSIPIRKEFMKKGLDLY
ncbi:glycosyltransferase family 2 protein [Paenibacillus glacialis]|uniref:glycosyltransferase family 2 protein n=1 Tax=Paenibacillus glacialis TaxID=494026 RepID=UPI000837B995|nr:glycosyltransferase family 2 protein [Paenibacillus glacialis]